jgi:hypothetical protein
VKDFMEFETIVSLVFLSVVVCATVVAYVQYRRAGDEEAKKVILRRAYNAIEVTLRNAVDALRDGKITEEEIRKIANDAKTALGKAQVIKDEALE